MTEQRDPQGQQTPTGGKQNTDNNKAGNTSNGQLRNVRNESEDENTTATDAEEALKGESKKQPEAEVTGKKVK